MGGGGRAVVAAEAVGLAWRRQPVQAHREPHTGAGAAAPALAVPLRSSSPSPALLCLCSPHTELAAYTTEHPVYRHINMRMQVGCRASHCFTASAPKQGSGCATADVPTVHTTHRCPPPLLLLQTTASSGVGGEQALAEVLHMTQDIFGVVGDKMAAAAAAELGEQQGAVQGAARG